jgi:phenylalanyl-tRNA synthetase beta chain
MKISYQWLKSLINIEQTPEEVANLLTGCGLEAEGVEAFESIKGGLKGIVIGKVLTCVQHPNADRLRLTTVDIGAENPLQIVCGAPNVAAGQTVLVAPVGTTVHPMTGEPFEIKKAKIRGELSEGMICAEDELSLGESHDGILVLPDTYEVGKPATDYFSVYSDHTIEIGLTANRGDAASHLGVARDLRALTNKNIEQAQAFVVLPKSAEACPIQVSIEDSDACIRYSGMYLTGIKVAPSPDWLKNRLAAIGVKSINNVVDVTNYVLHELGQPLHAFDATKISGNQIIVKKVTANTSFTTLDGIARSLNGNECMICDAEKPLAIGGVFGGKDSGITEETTSIFVESAYFNPSAIRKTAKHHGLSTDSSFRYERGTDPNATLEGLKRAWQLLHEIAGGELIGQIIDIYPIPVSNSVISFSLTRCEQLIGQKIPASRIKEILELLGMIVTPTADENIWQVEVSASKSDVTREADVIEEVLRIYGLDNIAIPAQLKSSLARSTDEDKWLLQNKVANLLSNNGFVEMLSNSLSSSAYYQPEVLEQAVKPLNPLSNELDVMRMNMLYNGLEMIQYNQNRKVTDIRAYEFGFVYRKVDGKYIAQPQLALYLSGNDAGESWNQPLRPHSIAHVKSYVSQLLQLLGIQQYEFVYDQQYTHYEMTVSLTVNDKNAGVLGIVKPSLLKQFDIANVVFAADLDWDMLVNASLQKSFEWKPVSPFPAVRRDLALLVDHSMTYKQIHDVIKQSNKQLIRDVNIFDIYQGEKIPAEKKSYAISMMLQHDEQTLTDKETDAVVEKVLNNLKQKLGVELRS